MSLWAVRVMSGVQWTTPRWTWAIFLVPLSLIGAAFLLLAYGATTCGPYEGLPTVGNQSTAGMVCGFGALVVLLLFLGVFSLPFASWFVRARTFQPIPR